MSNVTINGECGVSAKVLKDSVSAAGARLLTFEIIYWRGVLAELNTHRMLSRSSASSRAIPFKKMIENLQGRPVRFGQANAGMQDKGADFAAPVLHAEGVGCNNTPEEAWDCAKNDALMWSEAFYNAGYAKQVYNRLLEPFQMVKSIVTATELENLLWLRDDDAADPSIRELARCIREARDASTPELLQAGEWHLPHVKVTRDANAKQRFWIDDAEIALEDAIKVSCARTASVSFRNTDYGLEKSLAVYERLVGDERKHSSACEMAATPMPENVSMETEGVTALHKKLGYMSGNLSGWLQHRQFIEGNTYYG